MRLCFYMCLSFCPHGGVVSQHALQVIVPACLADREVPAPGGSAPGGVWRPPTKANGYCYGSITHLIANAFLVTNEFYNGCIRDVILVVP